MKRFYSRAGSAQMEQHEEEFHKTFRKRKRSEANWIDTLFAEKGRVVRETKVRLSEKETMHFFILSR